MGYYEPAGTLAQLIVKLEEGREFAHAGWQTILDTMVVLKGITILSHTTTFNKGII